MKLKSNHYIFAWLFFLAGYVLMYFTEFDSIYGLSCIITSLIAMFVGGIDSVKIENKEILEMYEASKSVNKTKYTVDTFNIKRINIRQINLDLQLIELFSYDESGKRKTLYLPIDKKDKINIIKRNNGHVRLQTYERIIDIWGV